MKFIRYLKNPRFHTHTHTHTHTQTQRERERERERQRETERERERERERDREREVLFNDALNTFYLRLYGVRHMVKDHSDSEKENPLSPHRLLLSVNSKGSFICTTPGLNQKTHF